MKQIRLFVCLLALFVTSLAQAQTEKGSSSIGGDFLYVNNENEQSMYSSNHVIFSFNGGYNYFLKDNFSVGMDFHIGHSLSRNHLQSIIQNTTFEDLNKRTSWGYGIGLNSHNYIRFSDKLCSVFHSRIGHTITKSATEYTTEDPNQVELPSYPWYQELTTNVTSVSINPGIVYFASPRLGLQGTFGGLGFDLGSQVNESLETDNERSWSSFAVRLNDFSFFRFGVSYFF